MSRALVELRGPIWNGGKPHIGVADFRIGQNDEVEVKITYRRKDGNESYPGKYIMKAAKLRTYPTQVVGSGVTLFVAPLRDWTHEIPEGTVPARNLAYSVGPPPEPKDDIEPGFENVPIPRNDKRWHKHTTHFACKERMDVFGAQTIGCCCTGHQCKKPETAEQESLL